MKRIRSISKGYTCIAIVVTSVLSLSGQIAEPILTKTAIPLDAGAKTVKPDYAGEFAKSGASSQIIPEGTFQPGIHRRWEARKVSSSSAEARHPPAIREVSKRYRRQWSPRRIPLLASGVKRSPAKYTGHARANVRLRD